MKSKLSIPPTTCLNCGKDSSLHLAPEFNCPEPSNEFVWTDELVGEFGFWYKHENQPPVQDPISAFKKSKAKDNKPLASNDWEVLAYSNYVHLGDKKRIFGGVRRKAKDGLFYFTEGDNTYGVKEDFIKNSWDIEEVRRNSDNTVWTVGEETEQGKITNITLGVHGMGVDICKEEKYHNRYVLWQMKKLPKPTPQPSIQETTRPPLGVMPEWRHKELRFGELDKAIKRYFDAFKPIPDEWIEEKYQLSKWINQWYESKK